jgi:indole-3-glycerol phosphate synthase
VIGVNNRNLATFEVSPEASERMARKVPAGTVTISESGIRDLEGLRAAAELGYHAVLIGEHFMRASDRAAEVRRFSAPGGTK